MQEKVIQNEHSFDGNIHPGFFVIL